MMNFVVCYFVMFVPFVHFLQFNVFECQFWMFVDTSSEKIAVVRSVSINLTSETQLSPIFSFSLQKSTFSDIVYDSTRLIMYDSMKSKVITRYRIIFNTPIHE